MAFAEKLQVLAEKVKIQADSVETEEATKTAFVMPFIANVLGYDIFDPSEVVPEFTADVGIKRGEKIDYAIVKDGRVQILVECKANRHPLTPEHASQLWRYFATTSARVAILTNGIVWQIYSDVDAPNTMDSKPFLTLDLLDIDKALLPELQKLSKEKFDLESVVASAERLKYLNMLKREIAEQFTQPSEDLIKLLVARVYEGRITTNVKEKFASQVKRAMSQYLNDQLNARLKNAFNVEPVANSEASEEAPSEPKVVTTEEEYDAFRIIKAIACSELPLDRIAIRDAQSYCNVVVDGSPRKVLAKLYFNTRNKYLGLLDDDRNETKVPLDSLEDIYTWSDEIRAAALRFA